MINCFDCIHYRLIVRIDDCRDSGWCDKYNFEVNADDVGCDEEGEE